LCSLHALNNRWGSALDRSYVDVVFDQAANARVPGVGGTTAEHDRNEVAIGAPD
jgi:hypothetical protein